jgi:hypothetical protein
MKKLVALAHQQASDIQVLEILKATEERWRGSSGADDMSPSEPEILIAKVKDMFSEHVGIH